MKNLCLIMICTFLAGSYLNAQSTPDTDFHKSQVSFQDGNSDLFLSSVKNFFKKGIDAIKSLFRSSSADGDFSAEETKDFCAQILEEYPNIGKMGLALHPDRVCPKADDPAACFANGSETTEMFKKASACFQ